MARIPGEILRDLLDETAAVAAELEAAEEARFEAELLDAEAADMALAMRMDAALAKWLETNGVIFNERGEQILGFAEVTDEELVEYCRKLDEAEEVY